MKSFEESLQDFIPTNHCSTNQVSFNSLLENAETHIISCCSAGLEHLEGTGRTETDREHKAKGKRTHSYQLKVKVVSCFVRPMKKSVEKTKQISAGGNDRIESKPVVRIS